MHNRIRGNMALGNTTEQTSARNINLPICHWSLASPTLNTTIPSGLNTHDGKLIQYQYFHMFLLMFIDFHWFSLIFIFLGLFFHFPSNFTDFHRFLIDCFGFFMNFIKLSNISIEDLFCQNDSLTFKITPR